MVLQKKKHSTQVSEEYEICVLCGKKTDIVKSLPLDMRVEYIPSAGQLCHECALKNISEEKIAMQNGYVYAFPLYLKKGKR